MNDRTEAKMRPASGGSSDGGRVGGIGCLGGGSELEGNRDDPAVVHDHCVDDDGFTERDRLHV